VPLLDRNGLSRIGGLYWKNDHSIFPSTHPTSPDHPHPPPPPTPPTSPHPTSSLPTTPLPPPYSPLPPIKRTRSGSRTSLWRSTPSGSERRHRDTKTRTSSSFEAFDRSASRGVLARGGHPPPLKFHMDPPCSTLLRSAGGRPAAVFSTPLDTPRRASRQMPMGMPFRDVGDHVTRWTRKGRSGCGHESRLEWSMLVVYSMIRGTLNR
jgi:hypothetical protein